jgi:hypothetical protein
MNRKGSPNSNGGNSLSEFPSQPATRPRGSVHRRSPCGRRRVSGRVWTRPHRETQLARAALRAERAKSGKRNAQKTRKFIFNFNKQLQVLSRKHGSAAARRCGPGRTTTPCGRWQ